jgi:hypothetical protein
VDVDGGRGEDITGSFYFYNVNNGISGSKTGILNETG